MIISCGSKWCQRVYLSIYLSLSLSRGREREREREVNSQQRERANHEETKAIDCPSYSSSSVIRRLTACCKPDKELTGIVGVRGDTV